MSGPSFSVAGQEHDHLLVLSAHPDDETLGIGGLLAQVPDGIPVDVVVASRGQASHPNSPTTTPEQLAELRRTEAETAIAILAPHAELHLLGLTDGGLVDEIEDVVTAAVPLVRGPGTLILSTYRHDGHPDHEAIAAAASAVAWRTDARLLEHPIWRWVNHDALPDDAPVHEIPLTLEARDRKDRAIAAHVSQVRPLSDAPGDEVILPPEMLAHFSGPTERLVEGIAGETSPFEALHSETEDPWEVRTSWYERRKRALGLAALTQERYAAALELGCSIGALAEDLLDRCARLVAVDESQAAVDLAQRALGGRATVLRAAVPEDWDRVVHALGTAPDLVVLSEVGYFLSPGRLTELARRIGADLSGESATVLACHWRHEIKGWPLRGDAVHEILDRELGLVRRSHLVEEDLVQTVWTR